MESQIILELRDLSTSFFTERGKVVAIEGISFSVNQGEILGVVGESGCGKSVMAQSTIRLYDEKNLVRYEGSVYFKGENLLDKTTSEMEKIRGNDIAMIFQDPLSSLNPVYTIGNQIVESIMIHQNMSRNKAYEKAVDMLRLTGIPSPDKRVYEYPHELSGGMRQRAMIAMALSCNPNLLIADEPSTALDVTIQAQIMKLILEMNEKLGMGVILITHDLGIIAEMCSRVIVMYLGQIVEEADINCLFNSPLHPYTIALLKSIPRIDSDRSKKLHIIEGTVPSLYNVPIGCRFAPRCFYANEKCKKEAPKLVNHLDDHRVRCFYSDAIAKRGKVPNGVK